MRPTVSHLIQVTFLAIVSILLVTQSKGADMETPIRLMKQGQQLVEQERYEKAIDIFKEMERSCGANDECKAAALFWLGRSYVELSLFSEAEPFVDQALERFRAIRKPLEEGITLGLKARVFQGKNDYSRAMDFYNQAESTIRRYGGSNNQELLLILTNRARLYIYKNDYKAALKDIENARQLLGAKGNPRVRGLLAEHEGLIASEKGEYPKAIKLFDDAIKFYKEGGNRSGECAALNKRGRAREALGQYSKALEDYEASINIAREIRNQAEEAFAWNNIGMVHRKRGNYEKSLNAYDKALKLRTREIQPQFHAETLANKALALYFMKSDAVEAIKNFRDCYEAAERVGAMGTQARALHNLAFVMKDEGRFKESRELSQMAIQTARQIGQKRFQAQAILRLGNLYEYYGAFDDALKQYKEAARIQREVGDQFFLSTTFVDTANIETREGQTKDAEKNFRDALDLRKKIGAPLVETLCNFSLFYLEKHRYSEDGDKGPSDGDYDKAWQYLREAQREINPNVVQDKLFLDYAMARYYLDKDPQKALSNFQDLRHTAQKANRLKFLFLANVGAGKAYEILRRYPEAEKEYQSAVDLAEKLRESLDVEAQRTFLDGEPLLGVKYVLAYEGLARVRGLQGNWNGALEASEYTKARAFADKLAKISSGSSYGVDPKLLSELNEVEKNIRSNYKRLEKCQAQDGDKSLIPELESERNRLDKRLREIKLTLKDRYPSFYATRFPSPLSIRQAILPSDQLILSYQVTDTGFLVFLCKGAEILHAEFDPTPRTTLRNKIKNYRDPVEEPETYKELAKMNLDLGWELGTLLLKDGVRRYIKTGQPVTILPHDCLEMLPFEMLLLDKGGKIVVRNGLPHVLDVPFFGSVNPITYFQSSTAMKIAAQKAHAKSAQAKVLVIADVIMPKESPPATDMRDAAGPATGRVYVETLASSTQASSAGEVRLLSPGVFKALSDVFDPLPETRILAKAAGDIFKDRAVVMERDRATLREFQASIMPNAKDFSQIVFATHGYFGDRFKPEIAEPFLLLSCKPPGVDNILRMSAVMDLDLRADNVTLLACKTGIGRYVAGEGTMGMGRAFQYAGAKSVLVSLWSVDEKPSVMLVKRFLEEQVNGKTTLDALQCARNFLKEQGYSHPFFWSSFILVGQATMN